MNRIVKLSLVALVLSVVPGLSHANDWLLKNQDDPKQWVMPTGNYAAHRYSRLTQINRGNVGRIKMAWNFSTGVLRGHEGGPLVVGNVLYIHTPIPNKVFALDLDDDARIIWEYNPVKGGKYPSGETMDRVISVMCCDNVNRGVAYAEGEGAGDGTIFLHAADTTLIALDAENGREKWKVTNMHSGVGKRGVSASTGTGVPFIIKDKVGIGCSGAEFGVRCNWTMYSMKDGSRVWRAYATGPDEEMLVDPERTTELRKPIGANSSLNTWKGDQWETGGGSIWGWYAWDPDADLLYYGTGNPSTWNPVVRPGDNKWTMTINARNPDTGMAKWLYQMTPYDEWDYDGVNEMILADITVKGKRRRALVHFDRNGFAYTMDRVTGELLVAEKYDPTVNWATHVDMKTGRPQVVSRYSTAQNGEDVNTTGICPAALGTKDQQPASFSPKTGIFYVPTNHVCMDYEPFKVDYVAGNAYVGATLSMYPAPGGTHLGNFIAWDAGEGKILWSIPEPFSVWSGALATAGDVVFYGTLEGFLKAVDSKSGKELFRFKTASGIIGNTNTWMHDGKQYIGVLSGVGGWAGIGLAAGLTEDTAGLGAVGAYKALHNYTKLGGVLNVFSL
ncbi:MAG: methanol/ethanol family PQQ-dependent dehydrogenase [Alphaproteobacteria bacterium GM7ARS4]|nr:methanol/ethanol family PQQ-dependent dehydrogenase [Alphaproteobacteria bacterium GM7ARS4]